MRPVEPFRENWWRFLVASAPRRADLRSGHKIPRRRTMGMKWPLLHEHPRYPAGAEEPRADVGSDHRPDLGDHDRPVAEDLGAARRQLLGLGGSLDVLD